MGPMKTRQILGLAAELEMKTSHCYERIGRMAGAEPFASDLVKLAKEEIVHANLLKTGKAYESDNPEAFGDALVSVKQLEVGREAAGQLIADIDAGKATLAEALERIRDLESAFEQTHLATLVEINDPRLHELFRALSFDDGSHKRRLEGILRDLRS